MTYTDHYNFPASQMMSDDLRKLRDTSKQDEPHLFIKYCFKVIRAKKSGEMPLRDAAYSIASTMFLKAIDVEPLFDEITSLAGELELPGDFIKGDPELKWQKLVELINKYSKQYQSEAWLNKVVEEQSEMERKTAEAKKVYGER